MTDNNSYAEFLFLLDSYNVQGDDLLLLRTHASCFQTPHAMISFFSSEMHLALRRHSLIDEYQGE
jgi:hypothetical protein